MTKFIIAGILLLVNPGIALTYILGSIAILFLPTWLIVVLLIIWAILKLGGHKF